MVYYLLAFELGNLTATEESLVDCYKKKRWSVWKSKSTQTMAVKRQRLCSQVSLCRLQQREENVLVDELACVGAERSQKRSVLTSKPVQALHVKIKSLCRRVQPLCRPWQKPETVCVDEKVCVGYVSIKKMFISTIWSVQAAREARNRLYLRVSLCGLCQ